MQITKKILETLEYHKVIAMLADLSFTDGARQRAEKLMPSDDYDTVLSKQRKTADSGGLSFCRTDLIKIVKTEYLNKVSRGI